MDVSIQRIDGNWDLGYSLDKQTTSSTPIGRNQWGHVQFDTVRPEAGEALFQLKYRNDFSQVESIANQLYQSLAGYYPTANLLIPMPPSKHRIRQPVTEISIALAKLMGIYYADNLLVKNIATSAMKDISSRDEKLAKLNEAFAVNDILSEGATYDVLIVDDLYDTGSSLEVATKILKEYAKIRNVYVATVTRRR